MTKELLIGEVTGVHGIRGELKVRPLTDDPERFYDLEYVMLKQKRQAETFEIDNVRLHKGAVLLTLSGISDRTRAEQYKNAEVLIERTDAVELEEDEFFIADLIGLDVTDDHGCTIGKVKDVLTTTGSVSTLEIKTPEKMIYVPFRKYFFSEIDYEAGKIRAQIPEDYFLL